MKAVWAAQSWRLGLTLQQLRRELRQLAADLLTVGWCQLRGQHFIEPDARGDHDWCEKCGWCPTCREVRRDLVSLDTESAP